MFKLGFCFILGTANANVSVDHVASVMYDCIKNFHPQHLQEVHVLIYQSSMLKSFIDAVEKCRDKVIGQTPGFMEKINEDMLIGM